MRTPRWFLAIFFLIVAQLGAVKYPFPYYPLPEHSAAMPLGTLSIFYNPAALALDPDIEVFYLRSFNSETITGDNTILLARNGIGFAYQNYHLSVSPSINAYTLAFSSRISRGFYSGTSYCFMKTDKGNPYQNDHFWSTGFLAQPAAWLSTAFVARNLKRMEFANNRTEIGYTLSLGFRPLKERLTLAMDWDWNEGQSFRDGFFKGYAAVKASEGVGFYGSVDEDGNFGLGINLSFGSNQIGSYHSYSESGKYRSGLIYSGYTYRPHGWVLPVQKRFLKLDLSGSYPETESTRFFWQKKQLTFLDLIQTLHRALEDPSISGLYLELNDLHLGWAQLKELRELLKSFSDHNKPVFCYLGRLSGNGSYYLASAADAVAMRKVDDLLLVGLLAEVTFYRGTLDKLGIVADLEHIGRYKSASDRLTRDSMSVYDREALDLLLDDTYEQFIEDISQNRDLKPDSLRRMIDSGPFTSEEAQRYGLIDDVLYPDEIENWLRDGFGKLRSIDFGEYYLRRPYPESWGEPSQIAIIPVEGALMAGRSGRDWLFGSTIGGDDLVEAIKSARAHRQIKGVVLRINSPGGDGLISDLIYRELLLLKKKKPLVVSMGNVAASAGYQIASIGGYIYAEPATVTGSIGVISGKLDLSGLYHKVGFNTYLLRRGKNSDYLSPAAGFREEQREKVRYQIGLMYDHFVETVAEGRGLAHNYVDSIGQGRVWSGAQAQKLKLIDSLGGLWEAVQKVRKLSGLSNEEVEFVSLPKRKISILDAWQNLSLGFGVIQAFLLGNGIGKEGAQSTKEVPYYFILPYDLEIY